MLCVTRKRLAAGTTAKPDSRASAPTARRVNASPALRPVPTAVAPRFSSSNCRAACSTSSAPRRTHAA